MKGKRYASGESRDGYESEKRVAAKHLEEKSLLGDVIWVKISGGSWWPGVVVDENTVSGKNKPSISSAGDVLVRLYGSYEYLYADPVKSRSEFEITLMENDGCKADIFRKSLEQEIPHLKSGRSKRQRSDSKGASDERVGTSKDKKSVNNRVDQEREGSNQVRNPTTPQRKINSRSLHKDAEEENSIFLEQNGIKQEENTTRKTPKQDGLQKKPEKSNSRAKATKSVHANEEARNNSHKGSRVRNGLKQTKQSPKECQSPDKVPNKDEPSTPSSGGTFFGRLQELRRTKVMQSLGLTAPSGSPFHKMDTYV